MADFFGEAEVEDLFSVLTEREKHIVYQRFGLYGGKPQTLQAIGQQYGRSRERIRQIQLNAMCKLRLALSKKEIPNGN